MGGSPSTLGKVPGPSITKPVPGGTEVDRCDKHGVRDGLGVPDHSLAHPAVEEECRGQKCTTCKSATSAGSTKLAVNKPNQRAFIARATPICVLILPQNSWKGVALTNLPAWCFIGHGFRMMGRAGLGCAAPPAQDRHIATRQGNDEAHGRVPPPSICGSVFRSAHNNEDETARVQALASLRAQDTHRRISRDYISFTAPSLHKIAWKSSDCDCDTRQFYRNKL